MGPVVPPSTTQMIFATFFWDQMDQKKGIWPLHIVPLERYLKMGYGEQTARESHWRASQVWSNPQRFISAYALC